MNAPIRMSATTLEASRPPAKTAGYEPIQYGWIRRYRNLPYLSIFVIEQMLLDETICIGLAARKAAMTGAEIGYEENGKWTPGVQCSKPDVADWAHRQIRKLWDCGIEHFATAQVYGWAACEVLWQKNSQGIQEIVGIEERHANDTRALVDQESGHVSGVRFLRIKNADNGFVDLSFPQSLFHAFNRLPGHPYGQTVLLGSYRAWCDKHLEGGALDVRRVFMHKDAYGGADMTYPEGTTQIGDREVSNRDIAREIVEQLEAGGVTTRPASMDEQGNELWKLTRASVPNNPAHIQNYPADLDGEMLRGMYVPDGVLKADDTGSWQGRLIPMGIMYASLDPSIKTLLNDIVEQLLNAAMITNWGQVFPLVVQHKPLAKQALEQQRQTAAPQSQEANLEGQGSFGGEPNQFRMSLDPVEAVSNGVIDAASMVRAAKVALRMSTDEGPKEGDTKAIEGKTYRFNRNSRWELVGHDGFGHLSTQTTVGELLVVAKSNQQLASKERVALHAVSPKEATDIEKLTGVKVDGRAHIIQGSTLIHILNGHGVEPRSGQLPLTANDIERLSEVLTTFDDVQSLGKNKSGNELLRFKKRVNGHIFVVEEARGDRTLAVLTAYKYPGKQK